MKEEVLFQQALERPPAERATFLREACAGDEALRLRVEAILQAHDNPGSFLQGAAVPPPETVNSAPGDEPNAAARKSDVPPAVIGHYKLLQQIGEGGFGIVYMAEQQQPIRRKVALKILKPGMDTRQVIVRFEAERQALALMDHANIARVFDGGATPEGRPYFVMELVKGVPITAYCDDNKLTPRQRLELFASVCQAVQHAHQKGIIHRDIKPSNVLVTLHDGRPVVKVIDFGIAKAVGQQLTEKTLFTNFEQVIGTPLYMSPEQAGLSGLDIDTRSDIYSLGVLLYELLTGATPFDKERLKKAAFDEIRRIIREEDPPKPSTRLSGSTLLPGVAAQRKTDPKRLSQMLRGELDWIVLKALEKDRNRRYESANAFAADVLHYLADEPVLAGPPTARYRLKKFLRRNRGPVLAGMLVLLVLVAGIIGTTLGLLQAQASEEQAQHDAWQAGQERDAANQARDAERKAKKAESVQRHLAEAARDRAANTLDAMTSSLAGDAMTRQQVITPEQRQFLTMALEYYAEVLKEKANDRATRERIATAALRVGNIEHRLGRDEQSVAMFLKARDLYLQLAKDFPDLPKYDYPTAACHNNLGNALGRLDRWSQAETEYRAAAAIFSQMLARFPDTPAYRHQLAGAHSNLGLVLADQGKLDESMTEYRTAIDISSKLLSEHPGVPEYGDRLAINHYNLGGRLEALGKDTEAESAYRAALDLHLQLVAKFPANPDYRQRLASERFELADVLTNLEQAAAERSAALELQKKLVAEFPSVPEYRNRLAKNLINLGNRLDRQGKREEAQMHHAAAMDLLRNLVSEFTATPGYRSDLARSHEGLGHLLAARGKKLQGQAEHRACLEICQKLASEFPDVPRYRWGIANSHYNLGALAEGDQAQLHYRAAIDFSKRLAAEFPAVPRYRHGLAASRTNLGNVLANLGQWDQAETEHRAALAMHKELVAEFPTIREYRSDLATSHNSLGALLHRRGKPDQVEYRAAIVIRKKLVADFPRTPDYRSRLATSHNNLGYVLVGLGKRDEAEAEHRAALEINQKLVAAFPDIPEHRVDLAASHGGLGILLADWKKRDLAETEYGIAIDILKKLVADFPGEPKCCVRLAGNYCNLGNLLREAGRRSDALDRYDQAIATLVPVLQKESRLALARQFLINSRRGRAGTLDELMRYAEAAEEWARVLGLDGNYKTYHQTMLMFSRVRAGQIEAALKDAEQLAKVDSALVQRNCACTYALAFAKTKDEKHALRALELLRAAVAKGLPVAMLKNNPDLAPLRDRADFRELIASQEKKQKN